MDRLTSLHRTCERNMTGSALQPSHSRLAVVLSLLIAVTGCDNSCRPFIISSSAVKEHPRTAFPFSLVFPLSTPRHDFDVLSLGDPPGYVRSNGIWRRALCNGT